MQELGQIITQIGILPAIVGYLLWEYAKRLGAIELQLQLISSRQAESEKLLEKLNSILEKDK